MSFFVGEGEPFAFFFFFKFNDILIKKLIQILKAACGGQSCIYAVTQLELFDQIIATKTLCTIYRPLYQT